MVLPTNIDETPKQNEPPLDYTLRIAVEKAKSAVTNSSNGELIIAADTTVSLDAQILGKPSDAVEAEQMLGKLRGRTHQVITALAIYQPQDDNILTDQAITDVPMRAYSDVEMQAYIASGDPFDKAGSYAIQNHYFNPVEKLHGCYANVVGLPLCHLARSLQKLGAENNTDVPRNCQLKFDYLCPVYERVLQGEL